jgi:hypothetical protein
MGNDQVSSVNRVKSGSITIAGSQHPVTSFRLSLAHQGIPTLRATIDPVNYGDGKIYKSADGGVNDPTLSSLTTKYKQLSGLLEQKEGRECSFEFSTQGDDAQELKLEGWILSGVGYPGLNTSGSIEMVVDIEHPICKLTEGNMHIFGLSTAKSKYAPGDGWYNSVVDALEKYSKLMEDNTVIKGEDLAEALAEKSRDLIDALKTNVVWKGNGWPTANINNAELKEAIEYAPADVIESINGKIPFRWFQNLMSTWMCDLLCTYKEEALTLRPFNPWVDEATTIRDDRIIDFSVPPTDPQPVAGCIELMSAMTEGYTVLDINTAIKEFLSGGAGHVETSLPGCIEQMGLPSWLYAALPNKSGLNSEGTTTFGNTSDEPKKIVFARLPDESKREVIELLAKQTFCTLFRSSTEAGVMCTLTLMDDDLIPGNVVAIETEDSVLLKFFITHVTHEANINSNYARTTVRGTYVRNDSGPNLTVIKAGIAENYLYGA